MKFIGDVHGKFGQYKELIRDVPESIQVGDMGVGFMTWDGRYRENPPHYLMTRDGADHRFIRGNHDNPEVCRRQSQWIPDGSVHKGVFCVGGGLSIDRMYRVEGLSWWPDEEIAEADWEPILADYAALKPEVVVTHDCPESIARDILATFNMVKIHDPSITRVMLQRMFETHQPEVHIFGHWHQSIKIKSGRTTFICLNELETFDIAI